MTTQADGLGYHMFGLQPKNAPSDQAQLPALERADCPKYNCCERETPKRPLDWRVKCDSTELAEVSALSGGANTRDVATFFTATRSHTPAQGWTR